MVPLCLQRFGKLPFEGPDAGLHAQDGKPAHRSGTMPWCEITAVEPTADENCPNYVHCWGINLELYVFGTVHILPKRHDDHG